MKSNKSSKKIKSVVRVLTILVCVGIVFSLINSQTVKAIEPLTVALISFGIGIFVGWLIDKTHDSSPPDALVISEENYVATWNDFVEEWNNDYIQGNVNLANYMMMYNLTYLDSVRRAEHDVASYVNLLNWSDVEENMTSLIGYKENITKFIVSTLHGYNRIEVSILQHIYDTDIWSYTTPMKYARQWDGSARYTWKPLTEFGNVGGLYTQYKVNFGTYPVGYDGNYDIGDKFYVTYIYIPNGKYITLKDLDSDNETTYYHGVYDLQGKRNEVINMSMCDSGYVGLDNTGVYLYGVPTDFDVLEDIVIYYDTGLPHTNESQSLIFEQSKYIGSFWFDGQTHVELYLDGVYSGRPFNTQYDLEDTVKNITLIPDEGYTCRLHTLNTQGYIYHDKSGGLKVVTDHAGTTHITDNLDARGRVGLDWMVDSYKSIYDAMIVNAKILWNLYHGNGWYSTGDIPSQFLVVPPDIIFDNIDALKNLPLDKAQAIYYAWMAQLIDFYNENPDYEGTYDDTNQTVFDDGIIFNASLVHGGKIIFDNHQIYISPLLGDLELCKNNSYNLTQKIFIYDITGNYIYYGYVGDNLTIYNISVEGVGIDCVSLGRQTMQDFLMGKYGFSLSFVTEWEFPDVGVADEIYTTIAIALICLGVPIWLLGGDKYKKFGILMVIVGGGIIIYLYVIPAIVDFFTFW